MPSTKFNLLFHDRTSDMEGRDRELAEDWMPMWDRYEAGVLPRTAVSTSAVVAPLAIRGMLGGESLGTSLRNAANDISPHHLKDAPEHLRGWLMNPHVKPGTSFGEMINAQRAWQRHSAPHVKRLFWPAVGAITLATPLVKEVRRVRKARQEANSAV